MKNFAGLIKEINRTFNSIILFDAILTGIVVFLLFYVVLYFFNLYPIVSVIPGVASFIYEMYIKIKKRKLRAIESAYPALNERLRTAADNINMENPIVQQLDEEVIREMRSVRVSSFLNMKAMSLRIFLTVFLCFSILILASFDINIDTKAFFKNVADGFQKITGNINTNKDTFGDISSIIDPESIYGEEEYANLGSEEIELIINPTGFELDLMQEEDFDEKEFIGVFPDEIFIATSGVYEENIDKDQHELVKNYFLSITEQ